MKHMIWVLLLIVLSASAPSVPMEKVLAHKITFKIKNAGITVDGSFSDLDADISFDPKDLDNSSLKASVGVASIKTGIEMRDKDLMARKYFYVEKFPQIRMVSKKITSKGKDGFIGTFDLKIRDVTKKVEVPFTFTRKEDTGTFSGTFTINRRDFGVGKKSIILADDVKVFIEVTTKIPKHGKGV